MVWPIGSTAGALVVNDTGHAMCKVQRARRTSAGIGSVAHKMKLVMAPLLATCSSQQAGNVQEWLQPEQKPAEASTAYESMPKQQEKGMHELGSAI